MPALGSNVSYAENNVYMDIKIGVLTQHITIGFNRSLYDKTECATFTELVAATNKKPYVIHMRMLFYRRQDHDHLVIFQLYLNNRRSGIPYWMAGKIAALSSRPPVTPTSTVGATAPLRYCTVYPALDSMVARTQR